MTISSTTRVAGPFTGNGTASAFPFAFKVFEAADLDVFRTLTSTGVVTTLSLTTDYTVTLNLDQNVNPGGTVTLVAGPLATGTILLIVSDVAQTQNVDLTNQGGFYPEVINDALDRATILNQQSRRTANCSVRVPSSETGFSGLLPSKSDRANQYLAFDSNGQVDIGGAVPDQRYYGTKTADPATRNDGSAVQAGDMYFNSVASELRLYNGSVWASPGNVFVTGVAPAGLTVTGVTTLNGGLVVRPSASAPSSNVTIGPGAGSTITGSNGSVAIGSNALAVQVDGAVSITNTVAGTLSTVGTNTNVQLVKASGVGVMAVYPIVTLTVGAGGDVTAIAITNSGSGATVSSGIVFRTDDARIDPAWRGTLAFIPTNTAVGIRALQNNTMGHNNAAVGAAALRNNTTGGNNTAVGERVLQNNTTGGNNSAMGASALALNTTGSANTAAGLQALGSNTSGIQNAAVGLNALFANTTGNNSIAVGVNALMNNTTGGNNTAIGMSAGRYRGASPSTDTVTVASSSVFIGYLSRAAGDSQTNQVVIAGENGVGAGSNTTTIGNSATTNTIIPAGDLTVTAGDITVGGTLDVTGQATFGSVGQSLINAQADVTASGTLVTLTGIPTWARRVTVLFNEISMAGSSTSGQFVMRVGNGSLLTSSVYASHGLLLQGAAALSAGNVNDGIIFGPVSSTSIGDTYYGSVTFFRSGRTRWEVTGQVARLTTTNQTHLIVGTVDVGGTGIIDRVGITTVAATNTFDNGWFNMWWE